MHPLIPLANPLKEKHSSLFYVEEISKLCNRSRRLNQCTAFLELHIEQGPLIARTKCDYFSTVGSVEASNIRFSVVDQSFYVTVLTEEIPSVFNGPDHALVWKRS
ncbi:uncharacterized protein LOC113330864 [Papaver somniferum]|uniref:uncharacterized protein LOC113330864 n=1 Tax=Papaver somniferum TaxID=3469 RepID=UPI000E6F5397|nr:uncharacterized protein LOC113330864 [Papaver somniferum]